MGYGLWVPRTQSNSVHHFSDRLERQQSHFDRHNCNRFEVAIMMGEREERQSNKLNGSIKLIVSLFMMTLLHRTKWKRQTAVGLELLAEAGNYAAVQRMLQTSPYWLSQYGNVATAALAAAATANPGMTTPTTTPFDIYYRQAAAALQQKHQSSGVGSSGGETNLSSPSMTSIGSNVTGTAPLYVPPPTTTSSASHC